MLVVDADGRDRASIVSLIGLVLREPVDVVAADTLERAMAILADAEPPHCLFLDAALPDPTTTEASRRLSDFHGGRLPCPVVVLDGSDDASRVRSVFETGAQDWVEKRWLSPPFLRRVIENAGPAPPST